MDKKNVVKKKVVKKKAEAVSLADINAILDRVARRQEEAALRSEEADRRSAEVDRQIETMSADVDKLCKKVGGMDDNIGHHAEYFFQNTLGQTLTFGGEKYDYIVSNLKCKSKKDNTEFDIVLINGKSVAIIEVKNRIHPNSIKELAEEKISKFRKVFTVYKNHKVYLGVAGFSLSDTVMEEAHKYGVGIIRQDGQSVEMKADHLKVY